MIRRATRRVGQRIDEREPAAWLEPAPGEREEVAESITLDVAQPEAGEQAVDRPVWLGPGVAHVQMRPEAMGHQSFPGTLERSGRRVVERQLALRREQRRPPAGAGGQLDDLAPPRQAVQPAPSAVQLRMPGRVV